MRPASIPWSFGAALDPIATRRIEELMLELKDEYTIVLVTHNMQQATRVADLTAFLVLTSLTAAERAIWLSSEKRSRFSKRRANS